MTITTAAAATTTTSSASITPTKSNPNPKLQLDVVGVPLPRPLPGPLPLPPPSRPPPPNPKPNRRLRPPRPLPTSSPSPIYTAEAKLRAGKPSLVSVPDLSSPSLYHSPRLHPQTAHHRRTSSDPHPSPSAVGILSPPLEPQLSVKSTKLACIVGVALDSFFKKISLVPTRSKSDFCAFVVSWAGQECRCRYEFNDDLDVEFCTNCCEYAGGNRIPLPWELLQPVLRIIGHCLLAPGSDQKVRDAASAAVKAVYAQAMHEIIPQAILAARSLIRLDVAARKKEREAAAAAATLAVSPRGVASNPVTPSKPRRPDMLLFS